MKAKVLLRIIALALISIFSSQLSNVFAQGSLTPPPGAPAPTMKSLAQIEPRTPISSGTYFITQPGSYYLTTNLIANFGIIILANDVNLDLNGFTVTTTTNSDGIYIENTVRNLCIRNGTVSQCGADGIDASLASNSQFDHLRLEGNAIRGLICGNNCFVTACGAYSNAASLSFNGAIIVGANCVVRDCTADANRGIGIFGGGGGTVIAGCSAQGNLGAGIDALAGSTVKDCTAVNNAGQGIGVGDACVVSFCSAQTNQSDGIVTGIGCTISGCSAVSNTGNGFKLGSESTVSGCTASQNNGDGIQVLFSCLVKDNTCGSNSRFVVTGGAGIHAVNSGNRIEGNVLNSDQFGIKVDGNENLITRNSARGSGVANYNLAAGNMVGTITNAPSSGAVLGSTGGSGLGTTDPWANFSY
jgi:parallel beta-helix repeat protein